jgi:hypothetical protein
MPTQPIPDSSADLVMRSCIQKLVTGPEFSQDLSFEETSAAMHPILEGKADTVQAAVLLIALRMKRKTGEAYPPVYARLARQAGFDPSAIPSLKQPARVFCYYDAGEESPLDNDPRSIGIDQPTRAIPLPENTRMAGTQGHRSGEALSRFWAVTR